ILARQSGLVCHTATRNPSLPKVPKPPRSTPTSLGSVPHTDCAEGPSRGYFDERASLAQLVALSHFPAGGPCEAAPVPPAALRQGAEMPPGREVARRAARGPHGARRGVPLPAVGKRLRRWRPRLDGRIPEPELIGTRGGR